jgi:hypothetical protein
MEQVNQEVLYQQRLEEDRQQIARNTFKNRAKKIIKVAEIAQEIEVSQVTMLLRFILVLSVIADIFGMIPFIGNIFAIFFGVIFFILYFINGLGKGMIKGGTRKFIRKKGAKWILRTVFISAEGVPIFGILPLFTILALIEIVLSQRTVSKLVNKMEELKSKLN